MLLTEVLRKYSELPLTTELLLTILKDYQRPFDKLADLCAKEILIQLRRGLYITGPALAVAQPEPFLIANQLYGPSYISLDSALFYHGFIPERVFKVTSVTTELSTQYTTPCGNFEFVHLPLPYYAFDICSQVLTARQTVLMASPEKALCDKIITTAGIQLRSVKATLQFLTEDLRIDPELLQSLNTEKIAGWLSESPKKKSVEMVVKTIGLL